MKVMWDALLAIVPQEHRKAVDRLGRENAQEIRYRLGKQPVIVTAKETVPFADAVKSEQLAFILRAATAYSPWTAGGISNGYITAPGGHRIGVAGEAAVKDGFMTGIRTPTSLCIRVARDFPGVASSLENMCGSMLVLGPPGSGKTTLLRDLIRLRSALGAVSVVDEREELFPAGFDSGCSIDVLSGCGKKHGIDCMLRAMGPDTIAVDEITAESDCEALIHAANCGVTILASAHAASIRDLRTRPIYRSLMEQEIFENAVVMRKDKSYRTERLLT